MRSTVEMTIRSKMRRKRCSVALVLLIASVCSFVDWPATANVAARDRGRSVSKGLVGKPVAVGRYLLWFERDGRSLNLSVRGYDADRDLTFSLPGKPAEGSTMATDGALVAWTERVRSREQRVQGYDLRTGQGITLLPASGARELGGIALDHGVLYYQDATPGHLGIYARDVATGQEQLITASGRNPVVADGVLLWSEESFPGSYLPPKSSLHMRRLDGSAPDTVLAHAAALLSSYDVSGDYVVWSFFPPAVDRRVHLYRLSTGASTLISAVPARYPRIQGNTVVWTAEPDAAPGQQPQWSLQSYAIDTGGVTTLFEDTSGLLAPWAIFGQSAVVFAADNDPSHAQRELFIRKAAVRAAQQGIALLTKPLRQLGSLGAAAAPSRQQTGLSTCGTPLDCGQVYASGYLLYDAYGRWPANGVQFFLPEYGINGWTFENERYWLSTANIDHWLDVARDQLSARTLRVFVDLPSGTVTPTSHKTIYDFALRANARGMRLGLVLHNSSSFSMTDERRNWITGLIAYFDQRGAKPLIAYASADNEINNHCGGKDCFDNNPAYVDGANAWVADFVALFRGSGILTTVGLSSEVASSDTQPAWYDFHKADSSGRTMAASVDFISPHNYGGGAYGVFNDLRYVLGYQRPIMLEEFGYPTDPVGRYSTATEGSAVCRDQPLSSGCSNTAPYFVEISLKAIREVDYAGGVAWMLADVSQKSCDTSHNDLWTGLFKAGAGYCGGTTTTDPSGQKATGYRVRLHHSAYFPRPAIQPTATPTNTPAPTAQSIGTPTNTATATAIPTQTPDANATPISTAAPAGTATPSPGRSTSPSTLWVPLIRR